MEMERDEWAVTEEPIEAEYDFRFGFLLGLILGCSAGANFTFLMREIL